MQLCTLLQFPLLALSSTLTTPDAIAALKTASGGLSPVIREAAPDAAPPVPSSDHAGKVFVPQTLLYLGSLEPYLPTKKLPIL